MIERIFLSEKGGIAIYEVRETNDGGEIISRNYIVDGSSIFFDSLDEAEGCRNSLLDSESAESDSDSASSSSGSSMQ